MNCPTCKRNVSKRTLSHRSRKEIQQAYYAKWIAKNDRREYWRERYRLKKEREAMLDVTTSTVT